MNTTLNPNDWSYLFFNSPDYLDIYRDMTGPARTRQELKFCRQALNWKPGDRILDAPCGAGRHVHLLERMKFRAVGLDFSEYLLQKAISKSTLPCWNRRPPRLVQGLLQDLPFRDESFDFIVCLFSSFGYGESDQDNLLVMREFARVLRPGGRVLIDVMNRHFIVQRIQPVYETIRNSLFVREERELILNKRKLINRITVRDNRGNQREYFYKPWLYNGWELSWIASKAGLAAVNLYGDFQGNRYDLTSERAMLVAEKRQ